MRPILRLTAQAALTSVLALSLLACQDTATGPTAEAPPLVKTTTLVAAASGQLSVSGTVKARFETPLAFQMGGRVLQRHTDAGQRVAKGTPLATLDSRDVSANVANAQAQLISAEAALATAQAELQRQQKLVAQGFVSEQTLQRAELAVKDASGKRQAAQTALTLSNHANGYTVLGAPASGVLTDFNAQAGQVLSSGQVIGLLAHDGERELEVFLPSPNAPKTAQLRNGTATLRELAASADPLSRTWRARYTLPKGTWGLGDVHVIQLSSAESTMGQRVPLGALDERAQGPQVWRVIDGQAQPVPVRVLHMQAEYAVISSPLNVGDKVVAMGVHMLKAGMAVRELAP